MAGGQQHWDDVYGARTEDALTWFEATPAVSLDLVRDHLQPGDAFIDIGAGASRLVDALLDEGFGPLAVLDLSGAALAVSRQRLGPRATTLHGSRRMSPRGSPTGATRSGATAQCSIS